MHSGERRRWPTIGGLLLVVLTFAACGAVPPELPGLTCPSPRPAEATEAIAEGPSPASCPLHPVGNQQNGRVDAVWADRAFAFIHVFDCHTARGCGSRVFRLDGPGSGPVEVARLEGASGPFRSLSAGGALLERGRDIVRLRATENGGWASESIAHMPTGGRAFAVDLAGDTVLVAGSLSMRGRADDDATLFRLGSDGRWTTTEWGAFGFKASPSTMAARPLGGDVAVTGVLEGRRMVATTAFQHFSPDGRPHALRTMRWQSDGRSGPRCLYGDGERLFLLSTLDSCGPTRHAITMDGTLGRGESLPAFGADSTFYRQALPLGDGGALLGGRSGKPGVARLIGLDRSGALRFTHAYADWGCAEVAALVRVTPERILVVVRGREACDGGDLMWPERVSYAWIRPDGACAE